MSNPKYKLDFNTLVVDGYIQEYETLYFTSKQQIYFQVVKLANNSYGLRVEGYDDGELSLLDFVTKCLGQDPPDHSSKWIVNNRGKTLYELMVNSTFKIMNGTNLRVSLKKIDGKDHFEIFNSDSLWSFIRLSSLGPMGEKDSVKRFGCQFQGSLCIDRWEKRMLDSAIKIIQNNFIGMNAKRFTRIKVEIPFELNKLEDLKSQLEVVKLIA
jgi:hypothetical protein